MKILISFFALFLAAPSIPRHALAADAAPSVSTPIAQAKSLPADTTDLVFPLPPDKPRIRLIRNLETMDDLRGRKEGFFHKLLTFFSGGAKIDDLFTNPYGVWKQGDRLYVTDTIAQRLAIVDLKEKTITYLGSRGDESLKTPIGVAADEEGNIYITDSGDSTVKAYSQDGTLLWKSEGEGGAAGKLNRPAGIALTTAGELLVADSNNRRIVLLSKEGKFIREMCLHAKKEYYALPNPNNVWPLKNGGFMVSDPLAARVHIFSSTGAAISGFGEAGDAPGYFSRPRGIATDSDGNIHVVDALHSHIQIFNREAQLLLWYGIPGSHKVGMALPAGIFIDKDDVIYIADSKNRRINIYQYIRYPEEKALSGASTAKTPTKTTKSKLKKAAGKKTSKSKSKSKTNKKRK